MKDFIFVTGNQHKADYLAKWLDKPIEHRKIDLEEIQSLDLYKVVEHKAREAYKIADCPVLVEDVSLTFTAMGRLPGTFIKWFLEELGPEGLCKLIDGLPRRHAEAAVAYAIFDGQKLKILDGKVSGTIADKPRGEQGFGWNPIFIPYGSSKTYAQMTDDEVKPFSFRAQAIEKLKAYLTKS